MLFAAVLKSIIRSGHLRLIDGAGRTHKFGDGTPPPWGNRGSNIVVTIEEPCAPSVRAPKR